MAHKVTTSGNERSFDGPYTATSSLKDQSGVYLVTTKAPSGNYDAIDVGESGKVKDRIEHHDRADEWPDHVEDGLYYSAFYCNETDRMSIESELRSSLNPPCGKR